MRLLGFAAGGLVVVALVAVIVIAGVFAGLEWLLRPLAYGERRRGIAPRARGGDELRGAGLAPVAGLIPHDHQARARAGLLPPAGNWCGCCGRRAQPDGLWCADCELHTGMTGQPHERTWSAMHGGADCPFTDHPQRDPGDEAAPRNPHQLFCVGGIRSSGGGSKRFSTRSWR